MNERIELHKENEAYCKVSANRGVLRELSEYLTFEVPGARFMPTYKNRLWDGKIRLLNLNTRQLYLGLVYKVEEFAKTRDYECVYDFDTAANNFSLHEAKDFVAKNKFALEPRDYQLDTFVHAIRNERAVYESPTASGKSFIMYMIMRWYLRPTLIIVPTTTLVHQLYSDFEDYGFNSEKYVHKIYSGQDKQTNKPVVITTWQSVFRLSDTWFDRFDVVLGDEAHLFKAKSLIDIMTKLRHCQYRYGFTGTLSNEEGGVHEWVLEGLFGRKKKVITTKELMDQGHVSTLNTKIITLSHSKENRSQLAKLKRGKDSRKAFQDEIDYLVSNEKRNQFIKNLTCSLEGNTLVLYAFVEKHGEPLYRLIRDADEERKVFFIHGGVKGEDRDEIRHIVNNEENAIIVASFGTLSTGINIPNLKNLIFASPTKSRIRNLQSIGRMLRKTDEKTSAILYDISDDLSYGGKANFTLKQLIERVRIYDSEQFNYKVYKVNL